MQAKLIVTFDRLSTSDFLTIAGSIVNGMTNNSHFPEPWAGQGLTLVQLTAAYTAFEVAYHASLTRDTVKIAQRNVARQTLTEILKRLALSLELMAQGDVTALTRLVLNYVMTSCAPTVTNFCLRPLIFG